MAKSCAVYFDYKRRTDAGFRKWLRKEKKKLDKSVAEEATSPPASGNPLGDASVPTVEIIAAMKRIKDDHLSSLSSHLRRRRGRTMHQRCHRPAGSVGNTVYESPGGSILISRCMTGTARANQELAEGILPPFGLSRLIRLVITPRRQSPGLFDESKFLAELMFQRVIDLEELLRCLAAELNMEYLVFLDSLPYMFRPSTWPIVTYHGLKEVHWFQGCIYDNVLGTVKLFEHLIPPNLNLDSPELALLLDKSYVPRRRANYSMSWHLTTSSSTDDTTTRRSLACKYTTPRLNQFAALHPASTAVAAAEAMATGLLLTSSVRVDFSDFTLTSTLPYPGTTSPSAPGALLPLDALWGPYNYGTAVIR
ncbi:hypothetical protein EDB84DRAFT_1440050 [Lactarius hengduanensis]|nr:hypothetical protein EDB84DRAFT_1440050 [Lactarius hengduanensis]